MNNTTKIMQEILSTRNIKVPEEVAEDLAYKFITMFSLMLKKTEKEEEFKDFKIIPLKGFEYFKVIPKENTFVLEDCYNKIMKINRSTKRRYHDIMCMFAQSMGSTLDEEEKQTIKEKYKKISKLKLN